MSTNYKTFGIRKNKTSKRKPTKRKVKASVRAEVAQNNLNAQAKFAELFKKEDFDHFVYEFSSKDLPLVDHMRSEEVNDPSTNREKTSDNVKRLYRCLVAGEWHFESIDIMIDSNGILLNGQHTLEAVAQYLNHADTPKGAKVKLGFKVGVDSGAMPYLDTQKKRSPQQNLRIKHGDLDIRLNRTQENIVMTEGRRTIHGQPFGKGGGGTVNFFEYENVIKKHSSMLDRIFGNKVLCKDFPHKAIGYAIFSLAKEDEELACEIMNDISDFHNQTNRGDSEWCDKPQEHELVELFRKEKMKRENSSYTSLKNARDGYRQEDFYPVVIDWVCENHDVSRKIFPI